MINTSKRRAFRTERLGSPWEWTILSHSIERDWCIVQRLRVNHQRLMETNKRVRPRTIFEWLIVETRHTVTYVSVCWVCVSSRHTLYCKEWMSFWDCVCTCVFVFALRFVIIAYTFTLAAKACQTSWKHHWRRRHSRRDISHHYRCIHIGIWMKPPLKPENAMLPKKAVYRWVTCSISKWARLLPKNVFEMVISAGHGNINKQTPPQEVADTVCTTMCRNLWMTTDGYYYGMSENFPTTLKQEEVPKRVK